MTDRIPPKEMAQKLAKLLKKQNPDPNYLKQTFKHVRQQLCIIGDSSTPKKLPDLLSDDELNRFYETVWKSDNKAHSIIIKLLLFTGVRNAELSNILLEDVDLVSLKIHIRQGKGAKDRYIPIPKSFRGELSQYIDKQQQKGAQYLFETNRQEKYSTRWIRGIVKKYALKAGIDKRIYPHLFRHQLLTFLTRKGISDAKIQLISGHSDRKSLSIYQDISLADVEKEYQEAMEHFPVI